MATLVPRASSRVSLGGSQDVRQQVNELRQSRTPYSDNLARSHEIHQEQIDSLRKSLQDLIAYLDQINVETTASTDGIIAYA